MSALEKIEAIAAEADTWCGPRSMTHHEFCGCQIARRLREALAELRAEEKTQHQWHPDYDEEQGRIYEECFKCGAPRECHPRPDGKAWAGTSKALEEPR